MSNKEVWFTPGASRGMGADFARAALAALLAVGFLCSAESHAQLGPLGKRLGVKRASLSDERVAAGLREALQVGTGNAVQLTGRPDGYFRNEAIKILVPDKLRTIEKGLRRVGYGG